MPDDSQDEFFQSVSDDSSYDPNGFYVASRNKKGFKTTLYLSTTPEIASRVGELVAMRKLPWYRTPGDVHRNGLVHILERDIKLANDPDFTIAADDLTRSLMIESELEKIRAIIDAETKVRDLLEDLSRQRLTPDVMRRIRPNLERLLQNVGDPALRDRLRQALDVPS